VSAGPSAGSAAAPSAGLPTLAQVEEARRVVAGAAIRTPLVRLDATDRTLRDAGLDIYLKLENLQPIGAFKIRGAANAMGHMSPEELAGGVVTASAGNMAQGVAWQARELGVPCTVIVPEQAPDTKVHAVQRLGATALRVTYDEWWSAFQNHGHPGVTGAFIHAFDDLHVMAGNGTIALEILEDLPDVDAIITPYGGGGLTAGVAAAAHALKPECRLYAAEVAGAAPLAASLAAGSPQVIDYHPSFVDGIGSKSVFPQMLERVRGLIQGSLVAEVREVAQAVLLMAERNRVIAEGAGACPVANALAGRAGLGKIVCVVSGGNIDLAELAALWIPGRLVPANKKRGGRQE
jgi:threonine dehydratase